jgi:hypothetical protein
MSRALCSKQLRNPVVRFLVDVVRVDGGFSLIRCIHALRRVMFEWDDYHRHHVARLPTLTAEAPENELLHYEYAFARFYTQSYFRYFGRAAIIPRTLPDT